MIVDLRIADNQYGNEQLTVTVPSGGEVPDKVSTKLPQLSAGGDVTFKAQALQHSDIGHYRRVFEEVDGVTVRYFSERRERSRLELEVAF